MYDYNGLDYKKFKDVMDIASWDNYPSWHKKDNYTTALDGAMQHDLMRSIKKAPFLLMESCPSATNWKPINKLKKPGIHLAASLQAVAHGSDSVLYFQLRQSQGASEKFHGAVIDHYGGDDTRIFREVTEVGEALEQIRETAGSVTKSPVAVLYDRENDWALKDAQGPRNEDMHYQETVLKQYRALRRKGYNTDVINMEHDLSRYRLVTAPMAYMFYHGYAEKLRAFAKNGGTLVISYWSGLVDETDKCYLEGTPHGLMEAAGIRTEEIDALYDWEENVGIPETGNHLRLTESYTCKNLCELAEVSDAEVLLRYGRDFYQGYPVLTHKKYGKGHVYYVAADMEAAFYEDFLGRAAEEAGVVDRLQLKASINGAEPWTDEMRKKIEGILHINSFDIYGLCEITGPGVAMDCIHHKGLHVYEDYFYPEILNPADHTACADGETGELVFTTLAKEGMPLIRYRTKDLTSIEYSTCECGRTLPRIQKFTGRTDDMKVIRGVNVFPTQVETALLSMGGGVAPHYMLIVDRENNLDVLTVMVEVDEKYFSDEIRKLDELKNRVGAVLKQALGLAVKVKLVEPKTIQRSEGKAKRVIDNRDL